eukprot:830_1
MNTPTISTATGTALKPTSLDIEAQIIIRFPEEVAEKIKNYLNSSEMYDDATDSQITMVPADDLMRLFEVRAYGEEYKGVLVDLPCHMEALKTFDNSTYYKSGDVAQMLVVHEAGWDGTDDQLAEPHPSEERGESYKYMSGLTQPTNNIRRPTVGIGERAFREHVVCACASQNAMTRACKVCGAVPRNRVQWAVKEIVRIMQGALAPRETYVVEDEEYWEEVTDDESEWETRAETPYESPHPGTGSVGRPYTGTPGTLPMSTGRSTGNMSGSTVRSHAIDHQEDTMRQASSDQASMLPPRPQSSSSSLRQQMSKPPRPSPKSTASRSPTSTNTYQTPGGTLRTPGGSLYSPGGSSLTPGGTLRTPRGTVLSKSSTQKSSSFTASLPVTPDSTKLPIPGATPLGTFGERTTDPEGARSKLQSQITGLNRELTELRGKLKTVKNALFKRRYNTQIASKEAELKNLQEQLQQLGG